MKFSYKMSLIKNIRTGDGGEERIVQTAHNYHSSPEPFWAQVLKTYFRFSSLSFPRA